MQMSMRRFTRLTNVFSKKVDNRKAPVALYMMFCNFRRIHNTLRVTPVMEAGKAITCEVGRRSRRWRNRELERREVFSAIPCSSHRERPPHLEESALALIKYRDRPIRAPVATVSVGIRAGILVEADRGCPRQEMGGRGRPERSATAKEREDEGENDRDDQTGGQGKIEGPAPALDIDVAG
jgi:hypothetical protein